MMGSRGYRGGEECDAFSRRTRRLMRWRSREVSRIKRRYWKRMRTITRNAVRKGRID